MKENETKEISFWKILLSVQLESFLWGFGTAIGELPPYYVARAAGNIILFLIIFSPGQEERRLH